MHCNPKCFIVLSKDLYGNIRLLDYSFSLWKPGKQVDIKALKDVQIRATQTVQGIKHLKCV